MKKKIIIISIFACLAVASIMTYSIFFNNNVYGTAETQEMQIQELRTAITNLESTQITETEYTEDQLRITALETKVTDLESRLNTAVTDIGTMQTKINEQGQSIISLKNRVASLEQVKVNKALGTWKGIIPAVGNVTYVFNSNGTVNYNIVETNLNNVYTYTDNMILTAGNVMFYNLTSENTMTIYYTGNNGAFYTYKLTKI